MKSLRDSHDRDKLAHPMGEAMHVVLGQRPGHPYKKAYDWWPPPPGRAVPAA